MELRKKTAALELIEQSRNSMTREEKESSHYRGDRGWAVIERLGGEIWEKSRMVKRGPHGISQSDAFSYSEREWGM